MLSNHLIQLLPSGYWSGVEIFELVNKNYYFHFINFNWNL